MTAHPTTPLAASTVDGPRRTAGNGSGNGVQPPSGSVLCRHCHGVNAPSRKFCGQCGKSLWEPCPKCGVEGPATETFCGSCGANIAAVYQERNERFQADLSRAETLRAAADYDQALEVLAKLSKTNALRLETLIQEARDRVASWTAERDARLVDAVAVLAKGRELQAAHAYETAVAVLDGVPEPLRSDEYKTFHALVRSQWKEVLTLGGDIRQAFEEKKTLELLPKLDRLIQLQPNHEEAKKLAEQLRERYVASAKKRLAAHQYGEALALLRQIPPIVRNSEVEDLQVRAAELLWLLHDLRTAPVIDPPLLAVAERLLKFAPSNQQVVTLHAQLQERAKTKPKDPRLALPLWAAPPQKSRLGLPVDWLGGLARLNVAESALAQFAKHPGCLAVAAGLALQGLEKSSVRINLLATKETSLFGGLTLLRAKKKIVRAAWGLDLTDSGLKAIKLTCDEKGEDLTIEACEVIEHKKNLNQPGVDSERPALIAATLRAFLEKHELAGCKVCASLPGLQLLGRFLDLPPLAKKQIAGVVEYEAKHQIPFPLVELNWDYQILSEGEESYNELRQHRVLILAAKQYIVQNHLATFKEAGIEVDALQSDAVALHNLAVHEFFGEKDAPAADSAIALVDVGSDATNVLVTWRDGLWFRTARFGGDDLTKALVRQFNLSFSQSEELKRDPTKARRLSQLFEALEPLFAQLASEIERSLAVFENERSGVRIERVYAVGGSLRTHGLLRHLRVGGE